MPTRRRRREHWRVMPDGTRVFVRSHEYTDNRDGNEEPLTQWAARAREEAARSSGLMLLDDQSGEDVIVESGVCDLATPADRRYVSRWWREQAVLAERDMHAQRTVPQVPEFLPSGRRVPRMRYRGAGVDMRMPSVAACRRAAANHDVFDVPVEALVNGQARTGWVRVSRVGGRFTVVPVGDPDRETGQAISVAVEALLEGRRPTCTLEQLGDAVRVARERAGTVSVPAGVNPVGFGTSRCDRCGQFAGDPHVCPEQEGSVGPRPTRHAHRSDGTEIPGFPAALTVNRSGDGQVTVNGWPLPVSEDPWTPETVTAFLRTSFGSSWLRHRDLFDPEGTDYSDYVPVPGDLPPVECTYYDPDRQRLLVIRSNGSSVVLHHVPEALHDEIRAGGDGQEAAALVEQLTNRADYRAATLIPQGSVRCQACGQFTSGGETHSCPVGGWHDQLVGMDGTPIPDLDTPPDVVHDFFADHLGVDVTLAGDGTVLAVNGQPLPDRPGGEPHTPTSAYQFLSSNHRWISAAQILERSGNVVRSGLANPTGDPDGIVDIAWEPEGGHLAYRTADGNLRLVSTGRDGIVRVFRELPGDAAVHAVFAEQFLNDPAFTPGAEPGPGQTHCQGCGQFINRTDPSHVCPATLDLNSVLPGTPSEIRRRLLAMRARAALRLPETRTDVTTDDNENIHIGGLPLHVDGVPVTVTRAEQAHRAGLTVAAAFRAAANNRIAPPASPAPVTVPSTQRTVRRFTPDESSAFAELRYDPARRTLEVEFRHGGSYTYSNVPPAMYAAFSEGILPDGSRSFGRFYQRYLRRNPAYSRSSTGQPGTRCEGCGQFTDTEHVCPAARGEIVRPDDPRFRTPVTAPAGPTIRHRFSTRPDPNLISGLEYHPETRTLHVTRNNGERHTYLNVPQPLYEQFTRSPVPNGFHNLHLASNPAYQTPAEPGEERCEACGQFTNPTTTHTCPARPVSEPPGFNAATRRYRAPFPAPPGERFQIRMPNITEVTRHGRNQRGQAFRFPVTWTDPAVGIPEYMNATVTYEGRNNWQVTVTPTNSSEPDPAATAVVRSLLTARTVTEGVNAARAALASHSRTVTTEPTVAQWVDPLPFNPESSWADREGYARFEAAYNEAVNRRERGEPVVPYRRESVTGDPDLTFGIEIEMEHVRDRAALAAAYHAAGLARYSRVLSYHADTSSYQHVQVQLDGSLDFNTGAEVVTPILRDTPEDWEKLVRIIDIARQHGAKATMRCGGHLNYGMAGFGSDTRAMANLIGEYHRAEDTIIRLATNPGERTHRNRGTGYSYSNNPAPATGYSSMNQARYANPHGAAVSLQGTNPLKPRTTRAEFRIFDGVNAPVRAGASTREQAEADVGVWQARLLLVHGMAQAAKRATVTETAGGLGSVHAPREPLGKSVNQFGFHPTDREPATKAFREHLDRWIPDDKGKAQVTALFAATLPQHPNRNP